MAPSNLNDYLTRIFASFERVSSESLKGVVDLLREAIESNCRIWIIGNGGSAATASHFATDLNRCANSGGESVKAMSLCDNTSLITAIGNDFGYDQVFSRQLRNSANSGDLLIVLSASGNSRNILSAMEWARNNRVTTLALTGFDGGQAKVLADSSLHVPTSNGDYGVAEDAHSILCHFLSSQFRNFS
jgi:D-sedoheptulose 7-phosphate isomerase